MNSTSIKAGALAQKTSSVPTFKGTEAQQETIEANTPLATKVGIPAALLAAMFGLSACDSPDNKQVPTEAVTQCQQQDDLNTLKSVFGFPFINQIYAERQASCERGNFELYEAPFKLDDSLKQKILDDSTKSISDIKAALETQGLKNVALFDLSEDTENKGAYKLVVAADPINNDNNSSSISNTGSTYPSSAPPRQQETTNNSFANALIGLAILNTMNNTQPQIIYRNHNQPDPTYNYNPPTKNYSNNLINRIKPVPQITTGHGNDKYTPKITTGHGNDKYTPKITPPPKSTKPTIPGVSNTYQVEPQKPLSIPSQPAGPTNKGLSNTFSISPPKSSPPPVNLNKPNPPSPRITTPSSSRPMSTGRK